ncbi:oligosaccharide flippase family protein [Tsuneonella sp. HG249]
MRNYLRPVASFGSGPIARDAIRSVGIRLIGLGLVFAQAVFAARWLGAEQYGMASVVLSVAQIASVVALFGLGQLAVRKVAREVSLGNVAAAAVFASGSLRWVLALSLLACAGFIILSLAGPIPGPYRPALLVGAFVIPPVALLQLQRGIAQGLGRTAAAQIPGEVLRPALLVMILLVISAMQPGIAASTYIIAFAGTAGVAMLIGHRHSLGVLMRNTGGRSPARGWPSWGGEAMPFLGISLVGILLGEINTLMLGWLTSAREAGLFQPVARLVPLMALPVQAAGMRFAPRVAELWALEDHQAIARLRWIFTWATTALTAAIVLTLVVTGPVLMQFFGAEFVSSARLLGIVGAAQIINAACGPVGMLLAMRGRARSVLAGQVAGLGASFTIGIWLIPSEGALGAALATAGGIVIWNFAMLALLRHERGAR